MTLLNVMVTEFVTTESRFLEKQRFTAILIYSQRKKKEKEGKRAERDGGYCWYNT